MIIPPFYSIFVPVKSSLELFIIIFRVTSLRKHWVFGFWHFWQLIIINNIANTVILFLHIDILQVILVIIVMHSTFSLKKKQNKNFFFA